MDWDRAYLYTRVVIFMALMVLMLLGTVGATLLAGGVFYTFMAPSGATGGLLAFYVVPATMCVFFACCAGLAHAQKFFHGLIFPKSKKE